MSPRCPQCGDALPDVVRRTPPVCRCRSCRTLSLVLDGQAREARTFTRAPSPSPVAFLCPLCGGPLPETVVADPDRTRCVYCGHPATLPPSVRAVLRLVSRHPRVAPPVYRGLAAAWIAVAVVFLLAALLEAFNGSRAASFESTLTVVPERQSESPEIRVRRRATTFPYLVVSLPQKADGDDVSLRVTLMETTSGRTRSQRLAFPPGRRYAEMSFSDRSGIVTLRPGRYRIVLDDLAPPSASVPATVRFSTWESPPLGLLILIANLLIWLLVLDIRWGYGEFVGTPPRNRAVRAVALALAVLAIAVVLLDLDPFGPAPTFGDARPAQAPAAASSSSSSSNR